MKKNFQKFGKYNSDCDPIELDLNLESGNKNDYIGI